MHRSNSPRINWPEIEAAIYAGLGLPQLVTEYRTIGVQFERDEPKSNGMIPCYSCLREEADPSAYVNANTGRYKDSGSDDAHEIHIWELAARKGMWGGDWKAARSYYAQLAGVEIPAQKSPTTRKPKAGGRRSSKKAGQKQPGIARAAGSGLRGSEDSGNGAAQPPAPAEDWRTALHFEPWTDGRLLLLASWCKRHKPGVTPAAFLAAGGRFARYRKSGVNAETNEPWEREWSVYCLPVYGESILQVIQSTAAPTDDELSSSTTAWVCWSRNPIGDPLTRWDARTKSAVPIKMKAIGSTDGVMNRSAILRLAAHRHDPASHPIHGVWKVEGPTDMLALYSSIADAHTIATHPIISFAGTATQCNAWQVELFRGLPQADVIHDADVAGQAGAKKVCRALAGVVGKVVFRELPGPVAAKHGLDLRDWLNAGNQYFDVCALNQWEEAWVDDGGDIGGDGSGNGDGGDSDDDPNGDLPDDTNPLTPIEAADDPHRLARDYIERHGSAEVNGVTTTIIRRWRDEWQRWSGREYRKAEESDLANTMNVSIKEEFDRLNIIAQEAFNERDVDAPDYDPDDTPPVTRKVGRTLVKDVLAALSGMTALPSDRDAPFWISGNEPFPPAEVFATGSGLIHLPSLFEGRDDYQLPVTPDFFSPNAVDYRFPDDDMKKCKRPDRWFAFLESLWGDDAEMIQLLQEWMGYCLLPDTSQQKIMLLIGPPRSGKGTICRVLTELVGELNVANPRLSSLGTEFGIEPLIGKTVGIISDARLSGRADIAQIVEALLSISGEDKQTVRRMYRPSVNTRLRLRFTIVSNELPALQDASGAFLNRCVLLQTYHSFLGNEDKQLEAALREELPGIMVWAAQGWWRLRERGRFIQPTASQELFNELYALTSPIKAFIDDCCDCGTEHESTVQSVYEQYRKWCETQGRKSTTKQVFGRDLRAAMPHIKTKQIWETGGNRERAFIGLALKEPIT